MRLAGSGAAKKSKPQQRHALLQVILKRLRDAWIEVTHTVIFLRSIRQARSSTRFFRRRSIGRRLADRRAAAVNRRPMRITSTLLQT